MCHAASATPHAKPYDFPLVKPFIAVWLHYESLHMVASTFQFLISNTSRVPHLAVKTWFARAFMASSPPSHASYHALLRMHPVKKQKKTTCHNYSLASTPISHIHSNQHIPKLSSFTAPHLPLPPPPSQHIRCHPHLTLHTDTNPLGPASIPLLTNPPPPPSPPT